jgi:hypothetical protein
MLYFVATLTICRLPRFVQARQIVESSTGMNDHRKEDMYLGAGQWAQSENQALVVAGFALMHEEADLWSKDGVLFGRKAALESAELPMQPNTARAAEEVTRIKLDMATAREIRRLHSEEGVSAPEVAKRYGVALSTIHELLKGEPWREPIARRRPPRRHKGLSDEEIAKIKRLRSLGLSQVRIGILVGVPTAMVSKVLKSP